MPADIEELNKKVDELEEEEKGKDTIEKLKDDEKESDDDSGEKKGSRLESSSREKYKDKNGRQAGDRKLWQWPLLIIILVPLNILLFYTNIFYGFCFATVFMALATFGIPYLINFRKTKHLIVLGTVVMLVSGACMGAIFVQLLYTKSGPFAQDLLHDDRNILSGGTIAPYRGNVKTSFNFTVKCTSPDIKNTTVRLIIHSSLDQPGFEEDKDDSGYFIWLNMTRGSNGIYYKRYTLIREDLYYFGFQTNITKGKNYTVYDTRGSDSKSWGLGPITIPYNDYLWSTVMIVIVSVFVMVGLLYYVLVGMFWWTQRAKKEREKYLERVDIEDDGKSRKEGKKKSVFTCSSCGTDVSEDDTKCPKCGESFDDECEKKVDLEKEQGNLDEDRDVEEKPMKKGESDRPEKSQSEAKKGDRKKNW